MNHEDEEEFFHRLEADMSAEQPGETFRVDSAEAPALGFLERIKATNRRPVLPDWLHSWAGFRDGTRWVCGHYWHTIRYQSVRAVCVYAPTLVIRTPRGIARTLGGFVGWVTDAEGAPLRRFEASREHTEEYLKLARLRDRRVRWRGMCAAVLVPLGTGLLGWLVFLPPLLQVATLIAGVVVFGILGAPADAPLSTRSVIRPEVQRLTSDMVMRAMASIGISQITQAVTKGQEGVRFVSPISREGPGWRSEMDLPLGVTVADVVDRRARLASALRRPFGCVWPDSDPMEHEGRLILWVGDRDLSRTGLVTWELVNAQRHDVFSRIPFGIDPRGRAQSVPVIQHNVLVGSLPGQGKTSAVRVLACGAALDPSVELWLHDLKGTGDLDPLEQCAHRFVSGIRPPEIAYAAESLRLLREEVMRRAEAMKKLPRDLCPDKRVTREIADKRSLRLWPLLGVFDECQNLFADSEYGKQAGEDAEFCIKVGRALGVILVLATQRPDKDSLPTGVSGNVSIRFCLKVAGQVENDMILGTSAYKNGLRATTLRPEIDAGNGYLVGATSAPTVVRTAYLDNPATERIAARARALRQRAGTLSGVALGQAPETAPTGPRYDLLADLITVIPATESRVWSEVAIRRLADLRPGIYGDWEPEQLTAALKPYGIATVQVWGRTDDGKGANRRGITRAHITAAIAKRDGTADAA